MSRTAPTHLVQPFSPLRLRERTLGVQIGAVLFGTALMTASSYVSVPMVPVPMTMQTLAATLIGALYGWRLGALTIAVWLLQGALGMPVFSNGGGGLVHLLGPTSGYLFGFVVAAALCGALAERGWTGDRIGWSFLSMLAGTALITLMGWAWLANLVGVEKAFWVGVAPFMLGGIVKSALGAAILKAMQATVRRAA
ncbi:MAG TPA: biotin transporter BioY [Hyphomicrobiaceae bacterium]|nr:biotin transporter BioY [Hyphomicrobiaceae bacterium]